MLYHNWNLPMHIICTIENNSLFCSYLDELKEQLEAVNEDIRTFDDQVSS